jgi:hypothetical protein
VKIVRLDGIGGGGGGGGGKNDGLSNAWVGTFIIVGYCETGFLFLLLTRIATTTIVINTKHPITLPIAIYTMFGGACDWSGWA